MPHAHSSGKGHGAAKSGAAHDAPQGGGKSQAAIEEAIKFLQGERGFSNSVLIGLHQGVVVASVVKKIIEAHKKGATLGAKLKGKLKASNLKEMLKDPLFEWASAGPAGGAGKHKPAGEKGAAEKGAGAKDGGADPGAAPGDGELALVGHADDSEGEHGHEAHEEGDHEAHEGGGHDGAGGAPAAKKHKGGKLKALGKGFKKAGHALQGGAHAVGGAVKDGASAVGGAVASGVGAIAAATKKHQPVIGSPENVEAQHGGTADISHVEESLAEAGGDDAFAVKYSEEKAGVSSSIKDPQKRREKFDSQFAYFVETAFRTATEFHASKDPAIRAKIGALTVYELAGVILYTGNASYPMNKVLRGELHSERWDLLKPWVRLAVQGLLKMKDGARNNQGTPAKPSVLDDKRHHEDVLEIEEVFRGDSWNPGFNPVFASEFKEGRSVHERGFMSTTLVRGSYGGDSMPVTRRIRGVRGMAKSVLEISQVASEKEALLPPGAITVIDKITAKRPGAGEVDVKDPHKDFPKDQMNSDDPEAFNQKGLFWDVDTHIVPRSNAALAQAKKDGGGKSKDDGDGDGGGDGKPKTKDHGGSNDPLLALIVSASLP